VKPNIFICVADITKKESIFCNVGLVNILQLL